MPERQGPPPALVWVFALAASIGPELGIDADLAGSVVSVTRIGYGCGLFFLI